MSHNVTTWSGILHPVSGLDLALAQSLVWYLASSFWSWLGFSSFFSSLILCNDRCWPTNPGRCELTLHHGLGRHFTWHYKSRIYSFLFTSLLPRSTPHPCSYTYVLGRCPLLFIMVLRWFWNEVLPNDFVSMSAGIFSVSMYLISISFSLTYSLRASNSMVKCLLLLWLPPPFISAMAPILSWKITVGSSELFILSFLMKSLIHWFSFAVWTIEWHSASVLLVSTLVVWTDVQDTRHPCSLYRYPYLLLLPTSLANDASQ